MLWPRVDSRRYLAVLLPGLIALAWLALLVWGRSPYDRYLSHHSLEQVRGIWLLIPVFLGGWILMLVAMMLPTSLPLINLFQRLTRARPHPTRLLALLVAGYLVMWTLFGVAVYLGDLVIHEGVEQSAWLEDQAWFLGAGALLLAGAYQFTPLKYACLDKCRSPYSFITGHWHGRHAGAEAFQLGLHHGLFCVGCCWSLMLLMFALGVGNIGWMLVLGAIMAVEKNMPWGRRLSAPVGVALLAGGLALLLTGSGGGL